MTTREIIPQRFDAYHGDLQEGREHGTQMRQKRPFNEIVVNGNNSNYKTNFPSLHLNRSSGAGGSGGVVNNVNNESGMRVNNSNLNGKNNFNDVNDMLFDEPNKMFGLDIFELIEKVANFREYYKTLSKLYEKQCAYLKFVQILTNTSNE